MDTATRKPLSVRRIIGAVIAVGLGGAALFFGTESYRWNCMFNDAIVAHPVSIPIDLSSSGITTAPFIQTYAMSHAELIDLQIQNGGDHPDSLLVGLKGKLELLDSGNKPLLEADFAERMKARNNHVGTFITLANFPPIAVGQYTLKVIVQEPALALIDHPQRLEARYLLCGLEQMPSLLAGILAAVAALPALIIGGFTLYGLRRYGWRRAPTQDRQGQLADGADGTPDRL